MHNVTSVSEYTLDDTNSKKTNNRFKLSQPDKRTLLKTFNSQCFNDEMKYFALYIKNKAGLTIHINTKQELSYYNKTRKTNTSCIDWKGRIKSISTVRWYDHEENLN